MNLLNLGLRRAQGPDGAVSASKYSYLGGLGGTSNVLAGKLAHIPIMGTHAHSFVMSYSTREDLKESNIVTKSGIELYIMII
jgi:nicotinate phosphoribosyltransferase